MFVGDWGRFGISGPLRNVFSFPKKKPNILAYDVGAFNPQVWIGFHYLHFIYIYIYIFNSSNALNLQIRIKTYVGTFFRCWVVLLR